MIIEQTFQEAGHEVTLRETNRRGHATRFAQDAANRGLDAVIALGGDGTVNEVANGLAGSQTALTVLPGGSTNVFARTIGLDNDPVSAAKVMAAAMRDRTPVPTGLGRVNGRYFCFHTGVGYDAAVVAAVENHASLKRWLGHPLFITSAITTFMRGYDRRRLTSRSTSATVTSSKMGTSRSCSTRTRTPISATDRSTSCRAKDSKRNSPSSPSAR